MKLILMVYIFISLICGIDAWRNAGWFVGVSALLAPMLAWWAGSGFRGSLLVGDKTQKIAGLLMAIIFLGVAHWLANESGFIVGLFGISFGGGVWYLIGAVIGFIATNKKDAASSEEMTNQ
jgi:hypothetical protein